jgi:hypothetical protein
VAILIPEEISARAVPSGDRKFHSFLNILFESRLDPQETLFVENYPNNGSYHPSPKGELKRFLELARRALPVTFLVPTFFRYGEPHCDNVPVG